jgi:hypothetical protein
VKDRALAGLQGAPWQPLDAIGQLYLYLIY